jgi:OmpA-OmpF porin, OOP family
VKLDRLFFVLALLIPAAAFAQSGDGGFYLGGALGQSRFKEWCDTGGSTITLASCKDTDTAWKVLGGYRFNRYLAAEGAYVDWGEVSASTPGGAQALARQHSYGLAAVGTLPLGARFQLFGKAGFLMTEQETESRNVASPRTINRDESEFHYGLGGRYAFTRNWVLRGEWENTDKLKVELLSIGVEYRF